MTSKSLTLRLPEAAYHRATALARSRNQSLNRLFQEGLDLLDQRERERQLFEDFSQIADAGSDEVDVGFAFHAQAQAASQR